MIRKIIHIDEDKCNGCGLCVPSCAEGAIAIINGKAKLVKDQYCDGLGACLGECPQGALSIIEREAEDFDEEAAMEHVRRTRESVRPAVHHHGHGHHEGGCPGSRMRVLSRQCETVPEEAGAGDIAFSLKPQLQQWPVQLSLVPVKAPYFENADLLITSDCVPFAYPDYHPKLLKGKKVVVGCPKLDDIDFYTEKLTAILKSNSIQSVTVAFMEVPCCSGIVYAAEQAIRSSGKNIPLRKVLITIEGKKQEL